MFLRHPKMYFIYGHRYISPTTVIILITLFVFSSFSLVSSIYRSRQHNKPQPIGSADDWDILIFAQNWPRSICEKWTHEGKDHTCYTFPENTWTIHGLWPTKLGTIGPAFCNNSRPFSPESIYGIEDDLLKFWSPIEKHKKKYTFWSHEWEKHGTCASVLPQLSTEFDYFYESIQLLQKYNIGSVLQKVGVSAGNSYNVTEIWDGVKKVLNKSPQVVCFDVKGNVSELIEVRICFDKSFNLVDCDGAVVGVDPSAEWSGSRRNSYHNLTNCRMDVAVTIPKAPTVVPQQQIRMETKTTPKPNLLLERLKQIQFAQWFTG